MLEVNWYNSFNFELELFPLIFIQSQAKEEKDGIEIINVRFFVGIKNV